MISFYEYIVGKCGSRKHYFMQNGIRYDQWTYFSLRMNIRKQMCTLTEESLFMLNKINIAVLIMQNL